MPGSLIISLDFELMWGVRDHYTIEDYGANVLGVRRAIPRMLELFERFRIHATWATVGMLMCESKDEILTRMPLEQPTYNNSNFSNYKYLYEVGDSEEKDKYYFGGSLVNLISSCPFQEIGTHTFSHFYCLEPGATEGQFQEDLRVCYQLMRDRGISFQSIVFPRNQYSKSHINICKNMGIKSYRGTELSWIYETGAQETQHLLRRSLRLADTYLNMTDHNCIKISSTGNVAASRFLRPHSEQLRLMDGLKRRRILNSMTHAAQTESSFHLWWHPHNFGLNLDSNISFLTAVLEHYKRLHEQHGMQSLSMGEAA